jgi:SAM-dependent methyltransferase
MGQRMSETGLDSAILVNADPAIDGGRTIGRSVEVAKAPATHYDDAYFKWQNTAAAVGADLNKAKFLPFLDKSHQRVLDFGCGSGALLMALPVAERVGIEINPAAVECAKKAGIEVHNYLNEIPANSIDAIISNHAIEHVEAPLDTLREMVRVLKPGGLAILVVPCDRPDYPFALDDPDFHLYSWSAGNFGNLARAAGLEVLEARRIWHRWLPKTPQLRAVVGPRLFDALCSFYGFLRRDRTQVRLVGRLPY